jgi:prepilin-type N-terminal cleavage/methylation domain-containing protein
MSRTRSNFAFTLLELVIVMALIAILAAIAVPSLSNFNKGRKLSNVTTQLIAVANSARAHAMTDGVVYRLNFDLGAKRYWLTLQQDDGSFVNGDEQDLNYTIPDGIDIATDIPQQSDGTYVEFQPSGRVTTATIRLVDTNSGQENDIGSLSATEIFHVFNDTERQGVAL